MEHMKLSFEVLGNQYLKVGGLYIIEDIKRKDLDIFSNLYSPNFEIIKTHMGNSPQDDFIAYKKIKRQNYLLLLTYTRSVTIRICAFLP